MFRDRRSGPNRAGTALLAAVLGAAALVGVGPTGVTSAQGVAADLTAQAAPAITPQDSSFASVAPARFADTRATGKTVDDQFVGKGPIAAGAEYEVQIAGRGVVPADAVGAIVELTAVNPAALGYFTLHPCGSTLPTASALNYTVGVNVANEVVAALSSSGKLCVFSSAAAGVVIDVVGYVMGEDGVDVVNPARLADSRIGEKTIDGDSQGFGRTSAGGTATIQIAGRGNVPMDATAAILNVGAVRPGAAGYLSVDACVPGDPTASSLNFVPGVNRANELIAQLDDAGSICIHTSAATDLIVDVVGFVAADSNLTGVAPTRFVETRPAETSFDGANQGGGPVAADGVTTVKIAGRGTIPANAESVIVNVGAVNPSGIGFLTLDGCVTPRPNTSSLNFVAGVNGANEVVVKLSAAGELCIYNSAATDLILDVVGYITPLVLVKLQIMAFNDYHGHVEAGTPGALSPAIPKAGGGEYLSSKLNELRATGYSVTAAAGDLIGGSPAFSGLFRDEPSVESLNAMGLDVSSVGNHEFDDGVTELMRMQNGGCHPVDGCFFPAKPYAGADFQWLAANVVQTATNTTPLPEYWVKEVAGVKVGFIGMTLEGTAPLVAAAGIAGYEFKDEAATANALVPVLKGQGVEAIVVLLHEGGTQTPPPGDIDACVGISGPIVAINAALDPEIDAMITGHTHLPYNCSLKDSAGNPRIVTSAFSFGRVVSDIELVLDRRTGEVDRALSSAMNYAVNQATLTKDPAVTAVITKWQPLYDAAQKDPIGAVTADILKGPSPGVQDRQVETPAVNLVADVHKFVAKAQIGFMNPGGVRSDLIYAQSGTEGDGVVTFGEAFTFQPFGNNVQSFMMTGAQIKSVLLEQCLPSRDFLFLGVSDGFTYDLTRTPATGKTCTSIAVTNMKLNGVAIDPLASYKVAANVFLADGGDAFSTFTQIGPGSRVDVGNDVEALRTYFAAAGGPVAPPPTNRVNELP